MAATVIVVDRLPRRLPRDDGGGRENLAIGADRHARSHAGTQGGKSLIRSDEWRVQFGRLLDEPTSGLVGGRTAIDEVGRGDSRNGRRPRQARQGLAEPSERTGRTNARTDGHARPGAERTFCVATPWTDYPGPSFSF
ncbi:uncharacterized protein PFL1_00768 [Pseudozyma flocculosa PF-1]|uniref:uncharacterized protein n=1 Tax=Pseudozyma flocculosa PF-1 TaxID=1277687 RepID=UPI00045616CC|nr:uncharacterized protein PFL1_00768 [Pseudozyma flocculosa PF-1]EPQ31433.1 hypothetical protein PFL1_00768 [Pseudozyma flocculosa PF-1]